MGDRRESKATVLVVEADPEERERLSDCLDQAGFEVLACPGPTAPDYTCIGGRGEPCPLAHLGEVVVLDTWLTSDSMLAGTSGSELLTYYLSLGKPVVALSFRQSDDRDLFSEEPVTWLPRRPTTTMLLHAVRAVANASIVGASSSL